jgi:hypothetical protein
MQFNSSLGLELLVSVFVYVLLPIHCDWRFSDVIEVKFNKQKNETTINSVLDALIMFHVRSFDNERLQSFH